MFQSINLRKEGYVSLQSFVLGLGIVSYFLISCINNTLMEWLTDHPWSYCGAFYLTVNVLLVLTYRGHMWQVAVRGCLLGAGCGTGIIVSVLCPTSYQIFGWYMVVLTFFHYSEYLTTAIGNPSTLTLDSYLLNHSLAYGLAAVTSWCEFFIERWLVPELKQLWYISVVGIVICLWGEVVRKLAMLTAKTNFNHVVQTEKQDGHELVTWGIYQYFRHPSYVGWFWWSVGTQVLLVNPICVVGYALASWAFFSGRIYYEELTLLKFFGQKYLDYQKKVGTGLPFIRGYEYVAPQFPERS